VIDQEPKLFSQPSPANLASARLLYVYGCNIVIQHIVNPRRGFAPRHLIAGVFRNRRESR
jgi:hypothetical protein